MSQWTLTLNLDNEEDRVMFQRIAHIDSLCSILWRLMYGMEGERLFKNLFKKQEVLHDPNRSHNVGL